MPPAVRAGGGLRLGYACVNTRLPSAARTVRLANAKPHRLRLLIAANLAALERFLEAVGDLPLDRVLEVEAKERSVLRAREIVLG